MADVKDRYHSAKSVILNTCVAGDDRKAKKWGMRHRPSLHMSTHFYTFPGHFGVSKASKFQEQAKYLAKLHAWQLPCQNKPKTEIINVSTKYGAPNMFYQRVSHLSLSVLYSSSNLLKNIISCNLPFTLVPPLYPRTPSPRPLFPPFPHAKYWIIHSLPPSLPPTPSLPSILHPRHLSLLYFFALLSGVGGRCSSSFPERGRSKATLIEGFKLKKCARLGQRPRE